MKQAARKSRDFKLISAERVCGSAWRSMNAAAKRRAKRRHPERKRKP